MDAETMQNEIARIARASQAVPGWLWPREVGALYRQLRQSRLHFEIGSFCGKSLYVTAAAMNGGRIIAIDPLSAEVIPGQDLITPGYEWQRDVLQATIQTIRDQFSTEVEWWPVTSAEAIGEAMAQGLQFDSGYIDGNHAQAACSADLEGWLPLIRPGGKLLGHDYYPSCMGVITAVNEFFHDDFKVIPETRIWLHQKKSGIEPEVPGNVPE